MSKFLNLIDIRIVLVLSAAILIKLLVDFEPGGEGWGYWFFAKEFFDGGGFLISGRSPLYILYLQLFYWIGFPYSLFLESFVTSFIVGCSLYLFLRIKLKAWYAILAVVVWLPFITESQPTVQSLALAMSCIAFAIRCKVQDYSQPRIIYSISYALLTMAYMFRPTYILLILLVVSYDLWRVYKSDGFKNLFSKPKMKKFDWPLWVAILALIIFPLFPSQHPWNNAWFASSTWFPGGDHASLRDAGFLQSMNWKYIENHYGSFEGRDIYFTNQELFNGAQTMKEALENNFSFVIEQFLRNLKNLLATLSWMNIFSLVVKETIPWIGLILGTALLFYGAFQSCKNNNQMCILLFGTVLLIGTTVVAIPKSRYMVPVVPFLIFSAHWYSLKINEKFDAILLSLKPYSKFIFFSFLIGISFFSYCLIAENNFISVNIFKPLLPKIQKFSHLFLPVIIGFTGLIMVTCFFKLRNVKNSSKYSLMFEKSKAGLIFPVLLLSFIPTVHSWGNFFDEINKNIFNIKEEKFSLIRSYKELKEISKDCNGAMTLEHPIFPLILNSNDRKTKIYDIWEIPPFGKLGDSIYTGLNVSRINCVFISDQLDGPTGFATNQKIRFENYIRPYEEKLISLGAITYNIKNYGRAVVLPK